MLPSSPVLGPSPEKQRYKQHTVNTASLRTEQLCRTHTHTHTQAWRRKVVSRPAPQQQIVFLHINNIILFLLSAAKTTWVLPCTWRRPWCSAAGWPSSDPAASDWEGTWAAFYGTLACCFSWHCWFCQCCHCGLGPASSSLAYYFYRREAKPEAPDGEENRSREGCRWQHCSRSSPKKVMAEHCR